MKFRPLLAVTVVFILLGVNGYLIYSELTPNEDGRNGIAPTEARPDHEMAVQDPLLDLRYIAGEREANFAAFGMSEAMVKKTFSYIRDLSDMHGERLGILLREAAEPIQLADALCGQTRHLRPRYGAMRFFVKEDSGVRRPVNLQRVSQIKRQEWALTSPIEAVYSDLELVESRQDDATLMGVAAILAGKEQDVLEHHAPWGRGLAPGSWSFQKVTQQNPGLEKHLVQYFALMHLAVELATAEGGICGE